MSDDGVVHALGGDEATGEEDARLAGGGGFEVEVVDERRDDGRGHPDV